MNSIVSITFVRFLELIYSFIHVDKEMMNVGGIITDRVVDQSYY